MFWKNKVTAGPTAAFKLAQARATFEKARIPLTSRIQLEECLRDAGVPFSGPVSNLVGRLCHIDTGERGNEMAGPWRRVFYGTISGVSIEDGTILTFFLSHDLFVYHNRSVLFDCFEKEKGWQSKFGFSPERPWSEPITKLYLSVL